MHLTSAPLNILSVSTSRTSRLCISTLVLIGAILAFSAAPSSAADFWNGDFQRGDFSQWASLQDHGAAVASVVPSPVRSSASHRYSGKFVVPPDSILDPYPPPPSGKQRSEVRASQDQTNGYPGEEVWYGWSTMFPDAEGEADDFNPTPGSWNYFTQFHGVKNDSCPPNIGFRAVKPTGSPSDVKMIMRVVSGDAPDHCDDSQNETDWTIDTSIDANHWYDFVLHVKWSDDSEVGFVELWVDGEKVTAGANPYELATLYDSPDDGVYAKQGFYRGPSSTATSTVFHEGMRQVTEDTSYLAGSAYDAVSPGGADVNVTGSTLVVETDAGSENAITVDSFFSGEDEISYSIEDPTGDLLSAGTGCRNESATEVTCTDPNLTEISVDAGDMNDSISILPSVAIPATLSGGSGDDQLSGGSSDDVLNGDTGEDSLTGNGGSDTLNGDEGDDALASGSHSGADGADDFNGGAGYDDSVSFASRMGSVIVDNDDVADDGAVGEQDNVRSDVERIYGGQGDDTLTAVHFRTLNLHGNSGNDTLTAESTGTNLYGGDGNDTMAGSSGGDWFQGGLGADLMTGGGGTDTINYQDKQTGVTIDNDGTADDGTLGEGDNVGADIEELAGGPGDDVITGSGGSTIFAYEGDDVLSAGLGPDRFFAGTGVDTVSYSARSNSVAADIDSSADDGEIGEGDTIYDAENLTGGSGNDTLHANGSDNVLNCGAGKDVVDYSSTWSSAGVSVSLANTAPQQTGGSGSDTLVGCNSLIGSQHSDSLTGGSDDNVISGRAGNDVVNGGGGTDTLDYSAASSGVSVSLSTSSAQTTGGDGIDTISNFENLTGSAANDDLRGDSSDNTIDGGDGVDRVSYANAQSAVTVSLATGLSQDTVGAGVDKLKNLEDLVGSAFDDTLTGSSANNMIAGGAGSDSITGNSGDDTILVNDSDNDNMTNCSSGTDTVYTDALPNDPTANCETVIRP